MKQKLHYDDEIQNFTYKSTLESNLEISSKPEDIHGYA